MLEQDSSHNNNKGEIDSLCLFYFLRTRRLTILPKCPFQPINGPEETSTLLMLHDSIIESRLQRRHLSRAGLLIKASPAASKQRQPRQLIHHTLPTTIFSSRDFGPTRPRVGQKVKPRGSRQKAASRSHIARGETQFFPESRLPHRRGTAIAPP